MIMGLFALGSFAFWVLSVVVLVTMYACVANNKGTVATITLLAFGGVLALFGNFNVFMWAYTNPQMALLYVAAYFALGMLWSIVKWHAFTRDRRNRYNELKSEFLAHKKISGNVIPDGLKDDWLQYCRVLATENNPPKRGLGWGSTASVQTASDIIPRAKKNKARIASWIGYWPISLTWALMDDVILGICNRLTALVVYLLQSISNRNFKGIDSDFASLKPDQN